MSIFDKQLEYKPFNYNEITQPFIEAIWASHWTHKEFTFESDIQDFHSNMSEEERNVIKRAALLISQVEVAVKSYWGNIANVFPQPDIADVGATFAGNECYAFDTELLTDKGFIYIKDATFDTNIAQFDLMTKEVDFSKPMSLIAKPFVGNMHHYKGKAMDIMITPNHEIITIHPISRSRTKHKSSEGKWSRNYRFPVAGVVKKEGRGLTSIERMLISLQADGTVMGMTPSGSLQNRRDVSWNITKERKIERLINILDNTGLSYNRRLRKDTKSTVISLRLPDHINTEDIKSFDWIDLNNISEQWADEFFEELQWWDAHKKANSAYYYNVNEKAIDKLQALASITGWYAHKGINRTKEQSKKCIRPQGGHPITTQDCFVLAFKKKDEKVYPKRKEVPYEGMVYCVEVPKNNIITRRNGCMFIGGNCIHSRAYSRILDKLSLNDDFKQILTDPAIKGRVDYLTKYVNKIYKNDRQNILYSLVLFTLFIENVSLFSQFYVMLGFQRFRGLMKDVSNVVDYTMKEETCFLPGTEVLTPRGFVDMRNISIGETAYGFKEGVIKEEPVLNTIVKEYDDSIVKIGNSRHSCYVTKDHDMIAYTKHREWFKEKAEVLNLNEDTFLPVTVQYNKEGQSTLTSEERLNIQTDDFKSFDWVNLEDKSKQWCEDFIDELIKQKGFNYKNKKGCYSSSKLDMDIIQHVATLAGYRVKIDKEGIVYTIIFYDKDSIMTMSESYTKELIAYKGDVVCITVPSGGLVTRYNNDIFIAGNCHASFGIALFNKAVEEFPELIDQEFKDRVYHEVLEAVKAEENVTEWMLEGYENEFLNKEILMEFLKDRINTSLTQIGFEAILPIDKKILKQSAWMREEILGDASTDFFSKKPTGYQKKTMSFTEDDLF